MPPISTRAPGLRRSALHADALRRMASPVTSARAKPKMQVPMSPVVAEDVRSIRLCCPRVDPEVRRGSELPTGGYTSWRGELHTSLRMETSSARLSELMRRYARGEDGVFEEL